VFLTLGGRYDYASTFGENASGVFYPKASISVIPSDLPAWRSTLLSTWRVRAAIGQSGRQPGAFDKLTTYGPLASQFGPGAVPGNLGNADLKPEIATEVETGMEMGLFEDVVGLDFTLWQRVVKDALVSRQFPISWGFQNQQLVNAGELEAKGAELSIRTALLRRQDMSLDLFANGAYLWQNVKSLGGAPPLKVGGAYPRYRNFLKEGHAPGALFGAKLPESCGLRPAGKTYSCLGAGQLPYDLNRDGQPDTEAQLLAALANPINPSSLNPLMVDEDGDGDLLDHYLGKPYPNWTGSVGGTFGYRGAWRLSTLFEYKAGDYTVTNLTDAFRRSNPSIGRNTREAAQVEATLLNPSSTAQQRLEAARKWAYELKALSPYDGLNQNEDGSFVRWRELALTWIVPANLTQRIGARDMEITFTGRNLKLWTGYTGIDPEANAIGRTGAGGLDNNYLDAVDAFGFPLPRRFGLSVRLGY
jgi:TonB-dependent starch-binding outer membrane protein SusC